MLKLQFRDQRKPAIWLVNSHYAIGSDPQNDIVLDDEGVSPHHAHMQVEDYDQVFISDAGSARGTRVNGEPVHKRKPVRAGDIISIVSVELELLDPKEQTRAAPADGATAISPAVPGLAGEPLRAGQPDWVLKARSDALEGQSRAIPAQGTLSIGRSRSCDLVLPSKHVSRRHAEIHLEQGQPRVRDLGSSNGTFVNQERVGEQSLYAGDELRFDTLVFEVQGPDEKPSGPEPGRSDGTVVASAVASGPDGEASAHEPDAGEGPPRRAQPQRAGAAGDTASARASGASAQPASADGEADPSAGAGGALLALAVVVVALGGIAWWLL